MKKINYKITVSHSEIGRGSSLYTHGLSLPEEGGKNSTEIDLQFITNIEARIPASYMITEIYITAFCLALLILSTGGKLLIGFEKNLPVWQRTLNESEAA